MTTKTLTVGDDNPAVVKCEVELDWERINVAILSAVRRSAPRHQVRDADYLRHGIPIIHSHIENAPEVQWLKRRINGEPILSFPRPSPRKS